jgi:uncharacterized repeat protein (TIGR03803 family)
MQKIGWKTAWAISVMCAITAIVSPAQTFTTLHSFEGRDGQYPYAGLVQATDGSLYGITADGGGDGGGTVFKISPNGAMTTLYVFAPNLGRQIPTGHANSGSRWQPLSNNKSGRRQ